MSRLSSGLTFRAGIFVPGLRCEGFCSHFSRLSGVFGYLSRKLRLLDQWARDGALVPSAFGTAGMIWQETQECWPSFLRPNSGSPPVRRAPCAKSKSRNQPQADRSRVSASRRNVASFSRLRRFVSRGRGPLRLRSGQVRATRLIVVFQSQMRDQFFAAQMAESVFQFHQLNEQIVLGIQAGRGHGRLEIKAEPFLNAQAAQLLTALGEVHEEDEVEDD